MAIQSHVEAFIHNRVLCLRSSIENVVGLHISPSKQKSVKLFDRRYGHEKVVFSYNVLKPSLFSVILLN